MVQMKPIDLKEVAKRFTEKYYPQWMSRFDRIWEMFEKTDLNKIVSDPAKSQYLQGNAFGIAGTAEPESKEYMSGIAIVAFTYQGAKAKDSISDDEIKKRISLVPNLKIIPGVQRKLENVISEMLPLMVEATVESKKEIIFTESELLGLHKKPSSKTYPFVLVEIIILKGRIHWLWGFVIFGEWTCGGLLDKHPRDQFFNYKSKTIKEFEKCGLRIAFERGGDELWIEDYETAKAKIKCNLFEAIDNYNAAVIEFENGNINKAIEKLELAISPPNYSNIKYINAYNLLIKCIFELNYQNISESLLKKIKIFLRWYKIKLEAAVVVIKNVYIKRNIISNAQIAYELEKLETEFKVAKNNYDAILKKIPITKNEIGFDEFVKLIQDLNEIIYEKITVEGHIIDSIYATKEFENLRNNKHVRAIFDLHIDNINKLNRYEDIGETEKLILFNVMSAGIDFDKYSNLSSLKDYLNTKLKSVIKKM